MKMKLLFCGGLFFCAVCNFANAKVQPRFYSFPTSYFALDVNFIEKEGNQQLKIGTFSQTPGNLGYCNCKYASSTSGLNNGVFVFATGNQGYMMINGKSVYFKLTQPNTQGTDAVYEVWTSEKYELVVQTKQQNTATDTTKQYGIISITCKSGGSAVQKVISSCS